VPAFANLSFQLFSAFTGMFLKIFADLCRPRMPLSTYGRHLQAFVTFEFGGLFQPTIANLCRGFAAAFCQVSVASLENQLAGIFQHDGLDRIRKLCRPSSTRESKTLPAFPNPAIACVCSICQSFAGLADLCELFCCQSSSLGLCRPFFSPFFASRFYEHLPTFAGCCQYGTPWLLYTMAFAGLSLKLNNCQPHLT
jgi:hypothetical protein